MSDEREILQEKLRRLHLDDPQPALRTRTLNAMREELARHSTRRPSPGWLARLAAWRIEALYAAAILACLVFLPRPDPSAGALSSVERRGPASASVSDEAIVRELGLVGDLAKHVRSRLALQRDLRPKRRIQPHDFQRSSEFPRDSEFPPC